MSTQHIQFILFDLGGVLVELSGIQSMISLMAQPVSEDELWRRWLASPAVRAYETGQTTTADFGAGVCDEFALTVSPAQFLDEFALWPKQLYPGVNALLRALSARYLLAILSNTNAMHWERVRGEMGLGDFFAHTFVSHEIGLIKPDREVFEHVVGAMQCAPEQVVFFDDNPTNVAQARAVGLAAHRTLGITGVQQKIAELGLMG